MAQSWAKNIINQIDPFVFTRVTETREYNRPIINVDWTIVRAEETTHEFGHDALILTAVDHVSNLTHDVVILDPFYPRGVDSLNDFIDQKITGVNPMIEYERNKQPALLSKYARVVFANGRKINPHVGIKHQKHTRVSDTGTDQVSTLNQQFDIDAPRSPFVPDGSAEPTSNIRKSSLSKGSTISPAPGVTIRYI